MQIVRDCRIVPTIGRHLKISDTSPKGKDLKETGEMRTWLAAVVVSCLPAMAAAQGTSYPTKPVTIVVPAAPGGVTDALGRTLAQRFTEPGASR